MRAIVALLGRAMLVMITMTTSPCVVKATVEDQSSHPNGVYDLLATIYHHCQCNYHDYHLPHELLDKPLQKHIEARRSQASNLDSVRTPTCNLISVPPAHQPAQDPHKRSALVFERLCFVPRHLYARPYRAYGTAAKRHS